MTAQQKLEALRSSRLWKLTRSSNPRETDSTIDRWVRYFIKKHSK